MPKYWLISTRSNDGTGILYNDKGPLYFTRDDSDLAQLNEKDAIRRMSDISSWEQSDEAGFQKTLVKAADKLPSSNPSDPTRQNHVTILIHGYNNSFSDSLNFYYRIVRDLYSGPDGMGLCILYDWPSVGSLLGYLPDRHHAEKCAAGLGGVFDKFYQWLLKKQRDAKASVLAAITGHRTSATPCRVQVSVIAHSMGNYLLQKAISLAWNRGNRPELASLISQCLMVAGDVDNDLFDHKSDGAIDGTALINLCYRITALYNGGDAALGASAGLKHFGTRRLGRSGLAHRPPLAGENSYVDNVWDVDCYEMLLDASEAARSGLAIHGAYFHDPHTLALMRDLLRGIDRSVLARSGRLSRSNQP